jgi:hypothetical protein
VGAKPDEWRDFVDGIASGDRTDACRQMSRRLGIKRGARPPSGQLGRRCDGLGLGRRDQDRVVPLMADVLQNPRSDHERYIGTHMIPNIHGVDPSDGSAPTIQKVATIET